MKWAIGIGLGVSLSWFTAASAGEPISVYPPGWVAPEQSYGQSNACSSPMCAVEASCASACGSSTCCGTNLWDSFRVRFGIGESICGPRCRAGLGERSGHCRQRIVEWLTWQPGPAVIPKHVPTPYPGDFLTSFPCVPCRQYTPAAQCGTCKTCGQGGPLPVGGHRGLPGGPVLMPRGGAPTPVIVSTAPATMPTTKPKVYPETDTPTDTDRTPKASAYEPRLVPVESTGGFADRVRKWFGPDENVVWTTPVSTPRGFTQTHATPVSLYPPSATTATPAATTVMSPGQPFTNP